MTSTISIFEITDSAGVSTAYSIDVLNDGGNNRFGFNVFHNGSQNQYIWPSSGSVQPDQIYRTQLKWDINSQVWEIMVNGKSIQSGALTGGATTLSVGLVAAGSTIGNAPMNVDYDIDNIHVSQAASEAVANGSESIVTLSTTGSPDSCKVKNITRATVTSSCSCIAGTCSVGLTGTSSGTGRFDYTFTTNGEVSSPAAVEITVP